MPSGTSGSNSGRIDSIEEANQEVPFTVREPSYTPAGYQLNQISVEEPNEVDDGWHVWFVYVSESGNPNENLLLSARPADDPRVPSHPYGVDEEVTVNGCPGTFAWTDHRVDTRPFDSPPSESTDLETAKEFELDEQQKGALEFIDDYGTYYYMWGPFGRDELVRIAASIG